MNKENQVGEQTTPYEKMMGTNPTWMESSPPDPIESLPAPRIDVEPMQLVQSDQTSPQGNSDGFNGGDAEQDQFKVSLSSFTEGVGEDPDTYGFRVNPGYLIMRVAAAGAGGLDDGLPRIMPLMNGLLPLDHPDVGELEVEAGDSIYLKVETFEDDKLKTDGANIVAAPSDQVTLHYQPVDPLSDGVKGIYYYKIADFEIDEETGALTEVKQIQGDGPIIHTPNLWTGENVGGGAQVFMTRDQALDRYKFRSVLGNYGVTTSDPSDEVIVNQNNENVGGGEEVWIPPDDSDPPDPENYPPGPSQLRTIRGLFSGEDDPITKQINVDVADGEGRTPGSLETIRVRGNSKKGALIFKDCAGAEIARLSWDDGLITNDADIEVTLGECTETTAA